MDLPRLFSKPDPPVRFALKFGTTMAATLWFAHASELSDKVSIFITVLFVMQPTSGGSIAKGIPRVVGTAAAALVSIAIYGLFAQTPPLFLLSLCAVIGVGVYGMTGPRHPYAWMVLAFTTVIILVKAMAGDDYIETIAFQRATETALGVMIVVVADSLFWPVRAESELREGLASWADRLAASLVSLGDPPAHAGSGSEEKQLPASSLMNFLQLAQEAESEIGGSASRSGGFARVALLLEYVASRVRLVRLAGGTRGGQTAFSEDQEGVALRDATIEMLARVSATLRRNDCDRGSAGSEFADHPEDPEESFAGAGSGASVALSSADSSTTTAFTPLKDSVSILRELESALKESARAAQARRSLPSVRLPRVSLSWPRFDPIRVRLSIRAALAAAAALVATLMMDWDAADQVAVIMAVIVAFMLAGLSSSRGAAVVVASGVVAGVLLGWLVADVAIVYFFPHLGRMPGALGYAFFVAAGAGYLIVRGSFLGPLGALFGLTTAILPIFVRPAAPTDVQATYDLVCGILLGVAVGFAAQRILWPRTTVNSFLERCAGQLDLCAEAVRAPSDPAGARPLSQVLTDYDKQLILTLKLHEQAGHEPEEEGFSEDARARLLSLIQVVFDASIGCFRAHLVAGRRDGSTVADEPFVERLTEATQGERKALVRSLVRSAAALRKPGTRLDGQLDGARAAVESQTNALSRRLDRGDSGIDEEQRAIGRRMLAAIASERVLVEAQLRVEAWIAERCFAGLDQSEKTTT